MTIKTFMFFAMKLIRQSLLWALTLLICALPTNARDSSKPEFIFLAKVPTYVPFQPLPLDTLLTHEHDLLKEQSLPDDIAEEEQAYSIEDSTKGPTWRGLFRPGADQSQHAKTPVLNLESDMSHLEKLATLFRNESFGTSDAESQAQFDSSMRLVLLANRMESIFDTKNQSLKHIKPDFSSSVLVITGTWEPKWIKKGKKDATLQEVRRYMQQCLKRAMDTTLLPEKRNEWKEKLERLVEEEKKGAGHVPYHELREYLRTGGERSSCIETFVAQHPGAVVYEATHDSDLVGLRIQSDSNSTSPPTGLYTHYLDILRSKKSGIYPTVLTTGYRIVYEPSRFMSMNHFAWVYQTVEEDRYARATLSSVDFRLPYIAEPNCLYLVPKEKLSIPQSFLFLPNGRTIRSGEFNAYDPCESMAIMHQMYKLDPRVQIYFDPTHPALMQAPARMLLNKKSKTALNFDACGSYDEITETFTIKDSEKAMKFSAQISQSLFSYRDYAMTLYRQFNLCGHIFNCLNTETQKHQNIKNADNLFKSLIQTLFNCIVDHETFHISYGNTSVENAHLVKRLTVIEKMPADKKVGSLISLISEIYADDIGSTIFRAANALESVREDHRKAFFVHDPQYAALRTSPTKAKTQSPVPCKAAIKKEILVAPIPIKKEETTTSVKLEVKALPEKAVAIAYPVSYLDRIRKLKAVLGTQKKVAETLKPYRARVIISQQRISEFMGGKPNKEIELALDAYEKTLSSTGG